MIKYARCMSEKMNIPSQPEDVAEVKQESKLSASIEMYRDICKKIDAFADMLAKKEQSIGERSPNAEDEKLIGHLKDVISKLSKKLADVEHTLYREFNNEGITEIIANTQEEVQQSEVPVCVTEYRRVKKNLDSFIKILKEKERAIDKNQMSPDDVKLIGHLKDVISKLNEQLSEMYTEILEAYNRKNMETERALRESGEQLY